MLNRLAAIVTSVLGALAVAHEPAWATNPPGNDVWGSMDCAQNASPGCELGAGTPGFGGVPGSPKPRGEGTDPAEGSGGGEDGAGAAPGDQSLSPGMPLKNCRYVPTEYQPPEGATTTASYDSGVAEEPGRVVLASYRPMADRPAAATAALAQQDPAGEEPGAWYVYECSGPGGVRDGLYRPPIFIPDEGEPPGGGAPVPSPEQLARQAYSQLRLPSPSIAASPEGPQLVRLPTWLWIENGWEPVSATATVPGVSVTARAKPTKVTWSMGEGGSRTCVGPGTPYSSARNPRSASPDCGYTYRRASGGDGFTVSATVSWSVSWSGAGQSGTFDGLSTTDSTTFVVEEVGAVNGR